MRCPPPPVFPALDCPGLGSHSPRETWKVAPSHFPGRASVRCCPISKFRARSPSGPGSGRQRSGHSCVCGSLPAAQPARTGAPAPCRQTTHGRACCPPDSTVSKRGWRGSVTPQGLQRGSRCQSLGILGWGHARGEPAPCRRGVWGGVCACQACGLLRPACSPWEMLPVQWLPTPCAPPSLAASASRISSCCPPSGPPPGRT